MPDGDLTQFVRPWLEHAPKPPPRGANSYDAFISYRSSDRAWAMALYDVLKLADGRRSSISTISFPAPTSNQV